MDKKAKQEKKEAIAKAKERFLQNDIYHADIKFKEAYNKARKAGLDPVKIMEDFIKKNIRKEA